MSKLTFQMIKDAATKAKEHRMNTVWIDGKEYYELTPFQAAALAQMVVSMEKYLGPIEEEMRATHGH